MWFLLHVSTVECDTCPETTDRPKEGQATASTEREATHADTGDTVTHAGTTAGERAPDRGSV